MNIRETDVAWNPAVVRIEYLDETGAPYYCAFHPRARPSGLGEPDLIRRRELPLGSGWDDVLTEALVGAFLGALAGVLLRTKGERALPRSDARGLRENCPPASGAAPPVQGSTGQQAPTSPAAEAAPPVQGSTHSETFLNPGQDGRK